MKPSYMKEKRTGKPVSVKNEEELKEYRIRSEADNNGLTPYS